MAEVQPECQKYWFEKRLIANNLFDMMRNPYTNVIMNEPNRKISVLDDSPTRHFIANREIRYEATKFDIYCFISWRYIRDERLWFALDQNRWNL